jgi:transposase
LAKQTNPERFANARQFAAYFGMVPEQKSSGQKIRLGRISKRGDSYVRSLMVQGAHAVLRHLRADSAARRSSLATVAGSARPQGSGDTLGEPQPANRLGAATK